MRIIFLILVFAFAHPLLAQDMEPRRWSHLPSDLNIAGVGAIATEGDIYFDPVMQIEDGEFELYTLAASYIRTFEWLGKSSRIDILAPYSNGRWHGDVQGQNQSVRRHGFGDPRVRLSMNLYGAPPLKGQEYMNYRVNNPVLTTVGVAVSATLPLGEYYPDRLINLGRNRYVLRTQLGVLHQRGPWQFELTTSLSFYSDNDEYLVDQNLEQEHLWFLQGHVIRSFKHGIWVSASGGFSTGGESSLNDQDLDNDERTRFFSIGLGMPLSRTQSVKVAWVNAETNVLLGTDSNSLIFSWSINWGK